MKAVARLLSACVAVALLGACAANTVRDESSPDDQIVDAEAQLFHLASSGTASKGFQSFLRALTDAVGRCADILSEHGVPANTTNELSNEPRFRDD